MSKTFVAPIETLVAVADYEAALFDLRRSETMESGIEKVTGVPVSEIKHFQADPETLNLVIVLKNPNVQNIMLALEHDEVEWDDNDQFINKLIRMVSIAGPVYHALADHSDWYKYFVFSYLTNRFDHMEFVERFTPEHFDPDYQITVINPVFLQGEASNELRLPRCAIERLYFDTCPVEQDQGYGRIHPFVISGPYFAFNAIIPMPHRQLPFDPKEHLEAVTSRDVVLASY